MRGILVLLTYQPGTNVQVNRILVPIALRESALNSIPSHRSAGHFGVRAGLERAKKYIFYPGLRKDIQMQISQCG